jgi:hypothetical protein
MHDLRHTYLLLLKTMVVVHVPRCQKQVAQKPCSMQQRPREIHCFQTREVTSRDLNRNYYLIPFLRVLCGCIMDIGPT